jgi:hypothetical protein
MARRLKIAALQVGVAGLFAGALVVGIAQDSFAKHAPQDPYTYTTCKPGNGFGDKNHCHTGPPGLTRRGLSTPEPHDLDVNVDLTPRHGNFTATAHAHVS